MDRSKCREIVDANISKMTQLLGVQHWKITVLYEKPDNPNWIASCSRSLPYQQATIQIDPDRADSEEDVLDSLRHELIHILLSPFDAYRDLVLCSIQKDSAMDHAEARGWTLAIESCVLAVERIFDWGLKNATTAPIEKTENADTE